MFHFSVNNKMAHTKEQHQILLTTIILMNRAHLIHKENNKKTERINWEDMTRWNEEIKQAQEQLDKNIKGEKTKWDKQ